MAHVHEAVKHLRNALSKSARSSCHCIQALAEDGTLLKRDHFVLAHFRGGGPRLALLAKALMQGCLQV